MSFSAFAFFEDEAQRDVLAQEHATAHEIFHRSKFSPASILTRRALRLKKKRDRPGTFCAKLMKLTDEQLAYYDPEYGEAEYEALLAPCRQAMGHRLKHYWATKNMLFTAGYRSLQAGLPSPDEGGQRRFADAAPLSFKPGAYLIDADLKKKKKIILTFDDGPHPSRTQKVLDILDRYNARSHFFEIGKNAAAYENVSRAVAARGHLVGSHSHSHRQLARLARRSQKAAFDEILLGHEEVSHAAGVDFPFFRFPFGASSPTLKTFLRDRGMTGFFWNIDTLDWKIQNPEKLYAHVIRGIEKQQGGIILFHDIHAQTVIILPAVLDYLHRNGYELAYVESAKRLP